MSNSLDLCQELEQNMIDYAYAVNSDRAIPSVVDGLKPVARRILWTMYEDKAFSNKAHVKSARIVGSCMGKYHPHGDSAIYEAMMRLGQNWVMRYPLVDVHGNVGGVTGDGPAASRYTESRLFNLSEYGFLTSISKNNIEYQPNYSEDLSEPKSLPAIFPNILCNPNEGIGLALACKWLPHNLKDIADIIINYIQSKTLDYSNLYPDFPLGGIIVNKDEISQIYKTGRGKVVIESRYHEETRNNKKLLVFTEIPYQVFLEPLIDQIGKAFDEEKIIGITKVQDESGKKGIRIVIELESKANVEDVVNQLFQETDLRKSINANCVGLIGKTPTLLNLQQVIDVYIEHNSKCIKREFQFDLEKTNSRIEIIEGLLKALANIDDIISIIRNSENSSVASNSLIDKYNFTSNQVKAILDMKLAKLTRLDGVELNNELQEKQEYATRCAAIVGSIDEQKNILVKRLSDLADKFGDTRRTQIIQKTIQKKAKNGTTKSVEPIEDVVITYNPVGYLQRIPVASYRKSNFQSFKLTTEDLVLLFSNQGRFFRISPKDAKSCGMKDKGTAIGSIIKLNQGEKIIGVFSSIVDEKYPYLTFVLNNGIIKKASKVDYLGNTRNLTGMTAIKLKDDSKVVGIQETNGNDIVIGTENNMFIRFSAEDVRAMGRNAAGVKAINLAEGDNVREMIICEPTDKTIKTSIGELTITKQGRGGKGKRYGS